MSDYRIILDEFVVGSSFEPNILGRLEPKLHLNSGRGGFKTWFSYVLLFFLVQKNVIKENNSTPKISQPAILSLIITSAPEYKNLYSLGKFSVLIT